MKKWYKEPTFLIIFWSLMAMGIIMVMGTSYIDGKLNPWGFLFCAFDIVIVVPLTYLMRNNP